MLERLKILIYKLLGKPLVTDDDFISETIDDEVKSDIKVLNPNKEYFELENQNKKLNEIRKDDISDEARINIKNVNVKDVVWSWMPLDTKDINRIPLKHMKRPYLIVGKDENYLYAFPFTSSRKEKRKSNTIEVLADLNPGNKDGFIVLNLVKLSQNDLLSLKLGKIDERVYRKVLYASKSIYGEIPEIDYTSINPKINEGCVVKYEDSIYLIYSRYNNDIYGYKLEEKKDATYNKKVFIKGVCYEFDYDGVKLSEDKITEVLYWNLKDKLNEVKHKRLKQKKEKEHITVKNDRFYFGDIVMLNNYDSVFQFIKGDSNKGYFILKNRDFEEIKIIDYRDVVLLNHASKRDKIFLYNKLRNNMYLYEYKDDYKEVVNYIKRMKVN